MDGMQEALQIITSVEKLPDAVELLRHAGCVQRCPQVRNVLVNVYAPRYQYLQTLVVTCTQKERRCPFLSCPPPTGLP